MKHGLSQNCHLFYSALANPTRLAILELLRGGPRNVTELAEALNQEQSMISHNLKSLERCRFVFSERRKKNRLYALNKETMEPLFEMFERHAKTYCPKGGECAEVAVPRTRRKRSSLNSLRLIRN